MTLERLHKVLAHAGVASRRAAERMIREGRVTVNGETVTRLGTRVDPAADAIRVDGRRVGRSTARRVYLLLNKPRGYVTTVSDPERRPTVMDLVRGVRERVYPVGRLDFNSEGLLILTNDGDLARALMHPSSEVPKTYRVKVRGRPADASLARLRAGVRLDGRRTAARVRRVGGPGPHAWLEITVTEGRKHHVRRMCRAIGHPALRLRRVAYGGLRLGDLAPGQVRPLTTGELAVLRKAVGGTRPRRTPRRGAERS